MTKRNIYQEVTDQIIKALENGVVPWVKPWDPSSGLPINAVSRRAYRGINVPLLWVAAMEKNFSSDKWLTFKQAKDSGGAVRGGEKGTKVILWKPVKSKDDENSGNEKERFYPIVRSFTVFNVAQIDGLPLTKEKPVVWEPDALADQFLSLADVQHGGGRAFYAPTPDIVQLPHKASFDDAAGYYSTALHELVHWTGHTDRLNRLEKTPHGSPDYAREELTAEMGCAFLSATVGIKGNLQHPEYLGNWLKVLKGDNRAIFRAASKAQQAVDFLKEKRGKSAVSATLERLQTVQKVLPATGPSENVEAATAA